MRGSIPLLLSVLAGYVDTAGFLALQGLFTAHVTGNFVTLAAMLVTGSSGATAKLLALPVFCVVVALARVLGNLLGHHPTARFRLMMGLQLTLLLAAGILAIHSGPFPDSDAKPALATGMLLVCAMSVLNAMQRAHLTAFPPSTMMTGNTTQMILDLVDLSWSARARTIGATWGRAGRMAATVAGFVTGCAAAALLFWLLGMWCFAVPPLLVAGVLAIPDPMPRTKAASIPAAR